ncbi:MAG TPA: hypothetical protein VHW23_26280 [Kofleriaceae bacterium]|nr:hypothetical protein [Kofleriaceae bacterium]
MPRAFYDQVKDGGLLLIVLKVKGGGDTLFLLEKVCDHFESREALPCAFLALTGKHALEDRDPIALEEVPEWTSLSRSVVGRRRFWWGMGSASQAFLPRTVGFRGFLGIAEPAAFGVFRRKPRSPGPGSAVEGFGLWGEQRTSLALASQDDFITTYGSEPIGIRFWRHLEQWFSLGMPDLSCFRLHAYPIDAAPPAPSTGWVTRQSASEFHWMIDG